MTSSRQQQTRPPAADIAIHSWLAPEGVRTRGTIIVLPGRGEHGGVYERFGHRLSADAYTVHALGISADADPRSIAARVREITAEATTPVVLVGSDTGALHALALTTALDTALVVDGLILAALPQPAATTPSDDRESDWDWELAARTTCPVHRARLTEDESFVRGSLSDPIAPDLAAVLSTAELELVKTPVLILHGGSDPLSSTTHARDLAARLPAAELAVVESTPHDVLNDSTHRTVAAHIVQWLERLRNGPELTPIISVTPAELSAVQ